MVTKFMLVLYVIAVNSGQHEVIPVKKMADSEEICIKAAWRTALELIDNERPAVITKYRCVPVAVRDE